MFLSFFPNQFSAKYRKSYKDSEKLKCAVKEKKKNIIFYSYIHDVVTTLRAANIDHDTHS